MDMNFALNSYPALSSSLCFLLRSKDLIRLEVRAEPGYLAVLCTQLKQALLSGIIHAFGVNLVPYAP